MTFVVNLLHASHIHWYFIEASQKPSAVRMVGAFILDMGNRVTQDETAIEFIG